MKRKILGILLMLIFAVSCTNQYIPYWVIFPSTDNDNEPPHVHSWSNIPSDYIEKDGAIYVEYACEGCSVIKEELFADSVVSGATEEEVNAITDWDGIVISVSAVTAQSVLDKIGDGSTVYFPEGTYGALTLKNAEATPSAPRVMKDIKLIGNDGAVFNPADNATCIALGSGNAGISTEDSDNDGVGLLIANFTFTGLGFSISTSGPNTYNDVVIQGCDFSGAEKQNAISIYNYTNPEFIKDVTVEGCSFSTYESAVLMFELNNATVRDNTFRNVEFGVNFSGAANKTGTLLIEDNISIGNTDISEWGGNAFVVQGPDNATIILRGNRIYDHEPESILYVANGYGSPKLTAEDNIYYSSEGSTAGIKLQEVSNEDISQVANGGSLTIKKDGTIKRSWTT